MTLALPKALTFRVNVGNDGIEKGLVAARLVDFGLPQGRLFCVNAFSRSDATIFRDVHQDRQGSDTGELFLLRARCPAVSSGPLNGKIN